MSPSVMASVWSLIKTSRQPSVFSDPVPPDNGDVSEGGSVDTSEETAESDGTDSDSFAICAKMAAS